MTDLLLLTIGASLIRLALPFINGKKLKTALSTAWWAAFIVFIVRMAQLSGAGSEFWQTQIYFGAFYCAQILSQAITQLVNKQRAGLKLFKLQKPVSEKFWALLFLLSALGLFVFTLQPHTYTRNIDGTRSPVFDDDYLHFLLSMLPAAFLLIFTALNFALQGTGIYKQSIIHQGATYLWINFDSYRWQRSDRPKKIWLTFNFKKPGRFKKDFSLLIPTEDQSEIDSALSQIGLPAKYPPIPATSAAETNQVSV